MDKPRALVIGGSLGGLLAAHLLRQAGWDAIIFERSSEGLNSRGAGLGTHPQLSKVLHRIGIAFDESMGVRVQSFICLDHGGNIVTQMPGMRMMTAWGRLYRTLRRALPADSYRLGTTFERFEQTAGGVTALFSDDTRVSGELLVGADGMRSTVRQQLLPQVQPAYAGYIAWRALLDEREVPADILRAIFARYTFCLPDGELLLGYPVPGRNDETQAGRRAYNMMWYRPVDAETLADLCTDADGHTHGTAIAPPLIRAELVDGIKAAARALLAPQIAELFTRAQPFFQAIFDMDSTRIASGRVVLLGDAAFVVRPHVGAGVTKAALDAAGLADALADHRDNLERALAQYDRRQSAFGRALVQLSRREGDYYVGRDSLGGKRDVNRVLHNHAFRSEQIAEIERNISSSPSRDATHGLQA
jgi:2-polyprenyl-6-methoxyphenol hydroxylase-like FAD-dependent oxidoreductase